MTPEPVIRTATPEALAGRGYLRMEMTDLDDRPIPLTRKGFRVAAGRPVRVKVFVRPVEPGDPLPAVQVTPTGDTFKTVAAAVLVADPAGAYYQAEYKAQLVSALPQSLAGFIPHPCRGEIVVTVSDGRGVPVRVAVAATVLPPAKKLVIAGGLAGLSLGVAPFFRKHLNDSGNVLEALGDMVREPVALVQGGLAAAAGFALLFLVRTAAELMGAPADD